VGSRVEASVVRTLVVHFSGGTEISIETPADPAAIADGLTGDQAWLVVEDSSGERHFLAVRQIAYLTFAARKGVGFLA
jgi:hypothetical protein